MKVKIRNRWNHATIYVAEDVVSLGAAILQAVATGEKLSNADLSSANLPGAGLAGTDLCHAKLRGADLRGAGLRGAGLRYADLFGADLSGADLRDADLSGADLRGAHLSGADLSGADLHGAHLSGADLTGATFGELGLCIPTVAQLDVRVLAAITAEGGALNMDGWHMSAPSTPVCGSTHCRAGWAVHLAGEAGYALEQTVGPDAAGALIYAKNTGRPVPDFFTSKEEALEDIKRCAVLAQSAGV